MAPRQYPGSTREFRGIGGRLRGRLWGPRGEKKAIEKPGSGQNCARPLGTIYHCVFLISCVTIYYFSAWRGPSHLTIGDFLGVNSPIIGPILEGPRGQTPQIKTRIPTTPDFGDTFRRNELPFRPYLHAHIPRMTYVSTGKLPQIIHWR